MESRQSGQQDTEKDQPKFIVDLRKQQSSNRSPLSSGVSKKPGDNEEEIAMLHSYIPEIKKYFTVLGKIGEGTFSQVYKARLKGTDSKVDYALKYVIPTSHPTRIANELKCLRDIGGHCNVMAVHTCIMNNGHVVIVMPYFHHEKFSEYVRKLTVDDVKDYMRNLFTALDRVHSFNIIHRDVKPSNFLYNRKLKKYALVDFGLAQHFEAKEKGPSYLKNTGKLRSGSILELSKKRDRSSSQENQEESHTKRYCTSERQSRALHPNTSHNIYPQESSGPSSKANILKKAALRNSKAIYEEKLKKQTSTSEKKVSKVPKPKPCNCFGQHIVCSICLSRPTEIAPRAGTPGFRAPEVLLKVKAQTTAVDMWSAGVIFISLLTGRYPFFRGQDDLTALAEIVTLLGSERLQAAAEEMGKKLTISSKKPSWDFRVLCEKLRGTYQESSDGSKSENSDSSQGSSAQLHPKFHESWYKVPNSAYDLLYSLLKPCPKNRITAREALNHPFLKE